MRKIDYNACLFIYLLTYLNISSIMLTFLFFCGETQASMSIFYVTLLQVVFMTIHPQHHYFHLWANKKKGNEVKTQKKRQSALVSHLLEKVIQERIIIKSCSTNFMR